MCGLSRAGKTTYAKALAEETGAELICLDDEVFYHPDKGYMVVDIMIYDRIRQLLSAGKDVIYDSMALCRGEREFILRGCCVEGCRTVCVFVDTPYEIIKARGGIIPAAALHPPTKDEDFDEIKIINQGVSA